MLANPEGGKGCSIILISSQLGLDGTLSTFLPEDITAGRRCTDRFSVRRTERRSVLCIQGKPFFLSNLIPTTATRYSPYNLHLQFAVRGLMSSAAQELGPKGIRVNAIAPGVSRPPLSLLLTCIASMACLVTNAEILTRECDGARIAPLADRYANAP
jgi:NAD(P)-dependent dehydrogenase (short-subunit alcohol dehydrogenase family)